MKNIFIFLLVALLFGLFFTQFWHRSPQNSFRLIKKVENFTEYELTTNGLHVLLAKAPYPGLAMLAAIYKAGSAQDAYGEFGTAHFLEHLTFRGTKKFNPVLHSSIANVLQSAGGVINAQTSNDVTTYYEILPSEYLELALKIEADRVRNALLNDDDIEQEIDVIENEFEILQNDPKTILENALWSAAFHAHPYRHPVIGYSESIQNMNSEILRKFYDQYYQPNNLMLAVTGDFETNRALSLIQKYFASIQLTQQELRPSLLEPVQIQGQQAIVEKSGTENWIAVAHKSPPGNHADILPLYLLSKILTSGASSRLHKSLVDGEFAIAVESEVSQLRDSGLFITFARLDSSSVHDQAEKVVLKTYEDIQKHGIAPDELEAAKRRAISDWAFAKDSSFGLIDELVNAVGTGNWVNHFLMQQKVQSITSEDIVRVARQYFVPHQSTICKLIAKPNSVTSNIVPKKTEIVEAGDKEPTDAQSSITPNQKIASNQPAIKTTRVNTQSIKINGTTVLLARTEKKDIVQLVGSIDGTGRIYSTNPILANLSGDLLDKNTVGFKKGEINALLEKLGAEITFKVDSERLTFTAKFLKQDTGKILQLLIKLIRFPQFNSEDFVLAKSRMKALILESQNSSETQTASALTHLIYPKDYPICEPNIHDQLDGLEKITLDDVKNFHRSQYSPTHLTLALAGDLDSKMINETLRKNLQGWKVSPPILQPAGKITFSKSAVQHDVQMPKRSNVLVFLGHGIPITRQHPDFVMLQMINFMLGGSSSSYLFDTMRQKTGFSYRIHSSLIGFDRKLQGYWKIEMAVKPEKKKEAIQALKNELIRFSLREISEAELKNKKAEIIGVYRIGLSSSDGLARQILKLHESGLALDELERFIDKIKRLTPSDIKSAIERYLHPEEFNIVTSGENPEENIRR